ncbi:hypothetical protein CVT24_011596 [Panaeolus cyanescens]|uniref:Uncharacterized protein n=1 Tax=Panaeolus cyanescens TaxID=181874 RepID=A0A409YV58_9AGAR|nr:hypothetical protein CVT24_011596 [Panaeolus cyanescens]
MIAGLSKAVTLYLTPLLALTAVILSIITFLAPTLILHDQVALLSVIPSTVLVQQNAPSTPIDGPSVFMGALGSCSRPNNDASFNCTATLISPTFDFTVLPNNAPHLLLSPPNAFAPVFIIISLIFSALFFITFTAISFRHKMGKASRFLDSPRLQKISAWIGVFGFVIGLTSFFILRIWFGKAVEDFNATIISQGAQGPKLLARVGNAFTMVWVAYAFYAVPIVISLTKLNVTVTKA